MTISASPEFGVNRRGEYDPYTGSVPAQWLMSKWLGEEDRDGAAYVYYQTAVLRFYTNALLMARGSMGGWW